MMDVQACDDKAKIFLYLKGGAQKEKIRMTCSPSPSPEIHNK